MKELDFIKQQILEIEDFDNISDALKAQIESDDEHRTLFESLREMSKNIASTCPSPEKDGVSLRNAVMKRVEDGDTAPRYINTKSFRFPFATVACLAVFAVVVFISKNGYAQKNFGAENAADMNYSVTEADVENGVDAISGAGGAVVYKGESIIAENTKKDLVFKSKAPDSQATQIQADGAASEKASNAEFQAAASDKAASGSGKEKSRADGGVVMYNYSVVTDKLKTVIEEAEEAVFDDADTADCETESIGLSEKVLSYISDAAKLCGGENRITREQILLSGEEKYIEFFESISGSENFTELYIYENFKAFCGE